MTTTQHHFLERELRFPGGVGGGVTSLMTGGGVKLWLGENNVSVVSAGSSEGVYKLRESTGEKV